MKKIVCSIIILVGLLSANVFAGQVETSTISGFLSFVIFWTLSIVMMVISNYYFCNGTNKVAITISGVAGAIGVFGACIAIADAVVAIAAIIVAGTVGTIANRGQRLQ